MIKKTKNMKGIEAWVIILLVTAILLLAMLFVGPAFLQKSAKSAQDFSSKAVGSLPSALGSVIYTKKHYFVKK